MSGPNLVFPEAEKSHGNWENSVLVTFALLPLFKVIIGDFLHGYRFFPLKRCPIKMLVIVSHFEPFLLHYYLTAPPMQVMGTQTSFTYNLSPLTFMVIFTVTTFYCLTYDLSPLRICGDFQLRPLCTGL